MLHTLGYINNIQSASMYKHIVFAQICMDQVAFVIQGPHRANTLAIQLAWSRLGQGRVLQLGCRPSVLSCIQTIVVVLLSYCQKYQNQSDISRFEGKKYRVFPNTGTTILGVGDRTRLLQSKIINDDFRANDSFSRWRLKSCFSLMHDLFVKKVRKKFFKTDGTL